MRNVGRCALPDKKQQFKKLVKSGFAAALKPFGFESSRANGFTRKLDEVVHVVSLEFYLSDKDSLHYNCSGFAFSVELGIHYECIPYRYRPIKNGNPDSCECELRKPVSKIIIQPEFSNRLVWSAREDWSDLPALITDAQLATINDLSWFDQLSDLNTAYKVICRSPEDMLGTWGQGGSGSPIRNFFAAFMAKRLGKQKDAETCFRILKKRNLQLDLHYDMDRLESEFLDQP